MPTEDRWYVSGSLGVGTAFDEATDAPSPLSLSWANVGSAIRREGGNTLNLLESGAATLNRGPSLNLWALNAGTPQKAVRLASISARFATTGDGGASGDLSFSTKPPNGDIAEALRITPQQTVAVPNMLTVGPVTRPGVAIGRIEVSGASAEFAFIRRSLSGWPASPAAGDRFVWYNPDGSARLWTEGAGDLLTIQSQGRVGLGTPAPQARLHVNGDAIVTGDLSWGGSRLWRDQGGSIELGGTNSTPGAGTPYIDFHFAGLTQDYNARVINDANGQLSVVASRVRVQGVFFVQGAVNDATARAVLDSLPAYSAIMAVEPTTQGTALCWYWKDGNNVKRKGWDGGVGF